MELFLSLPTVLYCILTFVLEQYLQICQQKVNSTLCMELVTSFGVQNYFTYTHIFQIFFFISFTYLTSLYEK